MGTDRPMALRKNTIKYMFGEKHKAYIRACRSSTYNVAEGAIRAGKTVDNIFAFAYDLKRSRDRMHLATGSTVANAKLNLGDANGFGLEHIFRGQCRWSKYKDNEALLIKGPDTRGQLRIVVFAGAAKADSFKKIRGNSYGMWIATEVNLHHGSFIHEAFNRTAAAHKRKFYWDLNPDHPKAKIYTDYIDRYKEKAMAGELDGYNYEHFTIDDNETISPERIAEIKSQYDPASVWYKRDILGRRMVAEGLIYDNFSYDKHVVSQSLEDYSRRYIGIDYGTQNPTVFLDVKVGGSMVQVEREYYYSGRESRRQKTDAEYADDLQDFMGDGHYKGVIVDPSAASFIAECRKRGISCIKAKNDVLYGIRNVAKLLGTEKIKVNAACKRTIDEFGAYRWDDKASERGEDRPVKENDHAMDALRYVVFTVLDGARPRTLRKGALGLR